MANMIFHHGQKNVFFVSPRGLKYASDKLDCKNIRKSFSSYVFIIENPVLVLLMTCDTFCGVFLPVPELCIV